MENEKNCYNCGHFTPYYFRYKIDKFIKINNVGHCSCPQIFKYQFNKIIKNQLPCECWYPVEEDIEKYKMSIFDKIDNIHMQLNCIASFLEENADIISHKND